MKPKYHLTISLVFGATLLYFTESFLWTLFFILAGFLPDLDHLIDFWVQLGFSLNYDVSDRYYRKIGKIYVLLHSAELLGILLFIQLFFRNSLFLAMILGLSLHILTDIVGNYIRRGLTPLFYFFVYRYRKDFDHRTLCPFSYEG